MEQEGQEILCPKCNIPMEDGACPVCDMRAIDIEDEEDEDEYRDWRERR